MGKEPHGIAAKQQKDLHDKILTQVVRLSLFPTNKA
jgi:hypothetical protein